MAKNKNTGARPYTTDYGLTKGHCATPGGAVVALCRYMVKHGLKHANLEGPNGKKVADAWYNGHFGFVIQGVRQRK